jgi:hypothetical protein
VVVVVSRLSAACGAVVESVGESSSSSACPAVGLAIPGRAAVTTADGGLSYPEPVLGSWDALEAAASRSEVQQARRALQLLLPNAYIALTPDEEREAIETNRSFDGISVSSNETGDIELGLNSVHAEGLRAAVDRAVESVSETFPGTITIVVLEDEVLASSAG